MRYVFGILAIAVAILLLRYNEQAYRIFGRWNWAERMFTSGGTRSGIKLIAILTIILAIVFMTDTVYQFRDLLLAPFKAAAPIVR